MSCPDCFKGVVHDHAEPKGKFEQLHGVKTYVALPSPTANPTTTILFVTDAFGLYLINNKLLADEYAEDTGFRVLVPDIIPGGGATTATMDAMNNALRPVGHWINYLNPYTIAWKSWAILRAAGGMGYFFWQANPPTAYPVVLKYARAVRAAMPADAKFGVAGFCWGGFQSTMMCKEAAVEGGNKRLIDAQFSAHPSALDTPKDMVEAVEKYDVPYSCAVAGDDFMFNKDEALKAEAAIKQKLGSGGTYEFKIYEGLHHGFTVRASHDEGTIWKEGYDAAKKQAVDWFKKYLS